ncbi:MAG: glycerate kinase [Candidatus Dadabacteria bacterium]
MNILIAPNAFKQSINAEQAADAMKEGFEQSSLHCECECFPVGDGGDGTGGLIIKKLNGESVEVEVQDPLGRIINTSFGIINNGKTAVIEMASSSGMRLLKREELNPLIATSYGTGEIIKMALDRGVNQIILAMGGSATVDGGCGILQALGFRFLNPAREAVKVPENLVELQTIDVTGVDERIFHCELIVLCDVANNLIGEQGAAATFGPQKGASGKDVQQLDAALNRLAQVILGQSGKDISAVKYGGTAGGAAAGLYGMLNAHLVNGIDYFLQLTHFDASLEKADVVITGEGTIDEQTLCGKGPFGVAVKAKDKGIPVIAVAGSVPLYSSGEMQEYFTALFSITNAAIDLPSALSTTTQNLRRTARQIGNLLSVR